MTRPHTATKPPTADGYNARTTEAVRRALIDIAHLLGTFRNQIVVIGGLVPSLTIKPIDGRTHVGTIDIDLALDAENLREDDAYTQVIKLLEKGGFKRGNEEEHRHLREFQMATLVDLGDGGEPIKVELDLLKPKDAKLVKHRPPIVGGLRVQDIDGLELAIEHSQEVRLHGHDRKGREDSATIRVVGPEAFLVLKGLALGKRREAKDCYDVYYVIRNVPDGPERLGESCRELLSHPRAQEAYREIRDKFSGIERYGPSTVMEFLRGYDAQDEDIILMDAYQQVTSWADAVFFV